MNGVLQGKIWDSDLKRPLKQLLVLLSWYADEKGGNIFPSLGTLGIRLGLSERHVRRQMRELEESGLITKTTRHSSGSFTYRILESALPAHRNTGFRKTRTFSAPGHFRANTRTFSDLTPDILVLSSDTQMSAELAVENESRNEMNLEDIWTKVTPTLQLRLGKHTFETWIKPMRLRALSESACQIELPNNDFEAACSRYIPQLRDAFGQAAMEIVDIHFSIRNGFGSED